MMSHQCQWVNKNSMNIHHYFLYHFLVVPTNFLFGRYSAESQNGSHPVGHCSSITSSLLASRCNTPKTSVLFDGNIPTLTGLDRNNSSWASDLFVMSSRSFIELNFTIASRVDRVELVVFSCPEWGRIRRFYADVPPFHVDFTPTVHSCESLVRVCKLLRRPLSRLLLHFMSYSRVYLGEITVYADISPCRPDSIVPMMPSTSTKGDETLAGYTMLVRTVSQVSGSA